MQADSVGGSRTTFYVALKILYFICVFVLGVFSPGSRRASDEPEEFEATNEQTDKLPAMTEKEREYLRWFYRTEDRK